MNDLSGNPGVVRPSGPGVDLLAGDPLYYRARQTDVLPARRFTVRDLFVRIFYRAKLLRNCLLAGLVLGCAAAWMATTYYTADALLLVLVGPESAATQDASGIDTRPVSVDGLKAVQSEIQIIQTDQVIRAAIEDVGVAALYPKLGKARLFGLLPPRDRADRIGTAVQEFRDNLRVETETGSNVIRVGFTNPNRDIAIRSVHAVVAAYLAQRRAIYSTSSSSFLDQEIAGSSRHLAALDADIQAVRARYGVLDMGQDIALAANRLDGIAQRQSQARERRVAVETEMGAVKASLATQPATVVDSRETTNNAGNDEARNTLVRLEQDRVHLTSQYGANWPEVREVEQKIAAIREQIGHGSQPLYFSEKTIRNPAIDTLNNRLTSLEVELKALGQQLTELDGQSLIAAQRIQSLRDADGQLHNLLLSRDVAETTFRQLSSRKPSAMFRDHVVDEHNADIRVIQAANAPLIGRTLVLSYLTGGAFLGLLLGITSSVIATLQQQVYIMPSEAERDLSLPSLGEFTRHSPKDGVLENPRELSRLAALLQDITLEGRPLASVQVVSTSDDDGKAAVVRALGVELAQGYEMRTLILDLQGDGRGQARAFGRVSVQPEQTEGTSVPFVTTGITDLYVSIDAPWALSGERRVSNARSRQVLERLRGQFGMVLVVASSDMSDHLARCFSGLVDANLLVLVAERTRSATAARLCDMIMSAGGNMLGFVFVGRKFYVPRWLFRRV